MKPTDTILAAINAAAPNLPAIADAHGKLSARIPGWSGPLHRLFFQSVFTARPEIKTVLILGVYLGRDIATMLEVANELGPILIGTHRMMDQPVDEIPRALQIVGVDKFADTPCADWPAEKRTQSWLAAGYGAAPNAEQALTNINAQPPHAVRLIEADDAIWLPTIAGQFDLVYVDTSHDFETVKRQLQQVRPLCHAQTVVAGDDYEDLEPTWGVKRAVTAAFKTHRVLGKTIWFADAEDFS